ncbi:alpha/beta hydrolase family esterase [Amaricoccus macauensis]|uniref:extracellular catalytic domain type 1 short-chain-length polyhydroxyalkanoate depolymerase n=1 Tax=Amaricoccus macauensis TaxID=57001 RepID=UPI003C7C369F
MNQSLMGAVRRVSSALRVRIPGLGASSPDCHKPDERNGGVRVEEAKREPFGFAEDASDWAPPPKDTRRSTEDSPSPQKSLRETVRLLRDANRHLEPRERLRNPEQRARKVPLDVPEGAGFHERSFSCDAGSRDYRLFVPSLVERPAQGLLVMLHGCTQTPEDFAAGTGMNALAEAAGFIVAYPKQTGQHSAMQCWNWYRHGDQRRGAGEPAILAGLATSLMEEFDLPEGRSFAAGLSAGGAMAAVLAEAYSDVFAAVGIHSGVAPGTARDVISAFSAMRGEFYNGVHWRLQAEGAPAPRVIVFHGKADRMVNPANARRIVGAARGLHPEGRAMMETGTGPGDRGFERLLQTSSDGTPLVEAWIVEGLGHAWSGGSPDASYTDAIGPDASREMLRFFLGARDVS